MGHCAGACWVGLVRFDDDDGVWDGGVGGGEEEGEEEADAAAACYYDWEGGWRAGGVVVMAVCSAVACGIARVNGNCHHVVLGPKLALRWTLLILIQGTMLWRAVSNVEVC